MKARLRFIVPLAAMAFAAFVSLGLPDGLNGVAWPSVRSYFNLPIDALGVLLVMFTLGYLASSFSSGWLLVRMNVGTLLALSCLATAVSLIGYALAPAWWVLVALGIMAGLGAGAIDAGLNTFAATQFSARMVNWLHACYGIGAACGPLLMTSVLAAHYQWQLGYAIVGGFQLLLALCFAATRRNWPAAHLARNDRTFSNSTSGASLLDTLKRPVVRLSIAVFFVYTGIEAAAGTWAFSLFTESRAISMVTAGMWVSIYWGALTAGRVLAGFVVGFGSVHGVLRACTIGMVIGATLVWLGGASILSFAGLGLMGLASAPVFPSLISATPMRLGKRDTANGVGFQIAAAVLGQSMVPAMVGVLAGKLGLEIVGPALTAATLILLALHEVLKETSARRLRGKPGRVSAG